MKNKKCGVFCEMPLSFIKATPHKAVKRALCGVALKIT